MLRLNNSAQGAVNYNKVLNKAIENHEVGVHLHTHRPGVPTSRLGCVGKKLGKKAMKELAEKLLQNALKTQSPDMIRAAINLAQWR
jgi:hypothetical protein